MIHVGLVENTFLICFYTITNSYAYLTEIFELHIWGSFTKYYLDLFVYLYKKEKNLIQVRLKI